MTTTYMTYAIEGQLLETIIDTLAAATHELQRSRERISQLEQRQLLSEAQAQAYLDRDKDTLRYYRTLGLDSFKKGQDRWYLKTDIDSWLASGKVNRHSR